MDRICGIYGREGKGIEKLETVHRLCRSFIGRELRAVLQLQAVSLLPYNQSVIQPVYCTRPGQEQALK